ncbi:MAG: hypothetical protein DYG90_00220 [Chloroflexi bacterium CFX6]|nr:hypothetical protein [Chloroflexi bacterium CFX6]
MLDWAGLIAAAKEEHEASGIHLSKVSALQAAIKATGQDIVTRERDWEDPSGRYVYEVGQNRATMERTVYVWDGRTGTITAGKGTRPAGRPGAFESTLMQSIRGNSTTHLRR